MALVAAASRSSFAAPSATSPSQFPTQLLLQDFAYPSQFPTQLLFQTIYFLVLPIIPGLPVLMRDKFSFSTVNLSLLTGQTSKAYITLALVQFIDFLDIFSA